MPSQDNPMMALPATNFQVPVEPAMFLVLPMSTEAFAELCREMVRKRVRESLLQSFDPAPWKTQLDSLAALVTSVRLALLARLLVDKPTFQVKAAIPSTPMHGFFENRVNKRNAP